MKESKTLAGPLPTFNITEAPVDPHDLFIEWFDSALNRGVNEPHTMTLSTIDANGFPDARVLILKDIDEEGWYFASSSNSNKGEHLEINPHVALTFYWSLVGRQVRIRGKACDMGKNLSAGDFLDRGKVPRAIALIGKQSSILEDLHEVDEAVEKQLNRIDEHPDLVFPPWTLYRAAAKEVEFWQAQEDRKHIRLKYKLEGGKWIKSLLWP
ncbi:pyridoxal 5'-phosphate synthase [Salipaludibacillus sp. CUR1]|uniref:pyridoxine/pyridoxamine 5'-phosphate oxidase n=1 Tax=Salipaludibacillus sp. CUR1 TaxID=2820003 RepID=UPI00351D9393